MELYTIGFTKKSARQFFELIKSNHIEMLVDIRLNNRSQLAGFTKGEDLGYFLQEICGCGYEHCIGYAPTKEILDGYKKGDITWDDYVSLYIPLMQSRNAVQDFIDRFSKYDAVCLLCSEPTAMHCHRRLFSELIAAEDPQITVKHI